MIKKILILALLLVGIATSAVASDQYRRHRYNQFKGLSTNEQSIVFVGNSITDMHNWPEAFGNDPRIVSRGVSGGFSYEVLANVYNWIIGHPAKVFIKIGTNDLNGYGTPVSVAANVEKTLIICRDESPATKVYIQSILPCQNGNRSDVDIRKANALLKTICDRYDNAEYVDLYNKMGGVKNGFPYGCPDKLHVAGAGYAVWCKAIEELVGIPTVYPAGSTAASKQNTYSQNNVHGGRISSFSLQPTTKDDIIFIGDGLVQSGEWHELLPGSGIKNHGSGWEVNSCDNGVTANIIDATLKADKTIQRDMPRAILLYACSESFDATTYENFIKKINGYSTDIKVYCLSLQPKAKAYSTANNTSIKNICAKYDNVSYIDISTELAKHLSDATYYTENLPYYMSYVTIAQQIAAQAPELGLTALTASQAKRNFALAEAAEIIINAKAGSGISEYATDKMEAVRTALNTLKTATTDSDINSATTALTNAITALKKALNPATTENTAGRQFMLSTPNRSGLYAYAKSNAVYGAKSADRSDKAFCWTLEDHGDGTFDIKNVATGEYMNPAVKHDSQITTVATAPAAGFKLEYSDAAGLYIIRSGSNCQLNSTDKAGNPIYNWYGSANTNRADLGCQWRVEEISDEAADDAEATFAYTHVEQGKVTTGIGNKNCAILRSSIGSSGLAGSISLSGVSGRVKNAQYVTAVRAFVATNAQELYVDDTNSMPWREQNGRLFGEGTLADDGSFTITGSTRLAAGEQYLWIAIDIAPDAKEGATVDAVIDSYVIGGQEVKEEAGDPAMEATIFLTESAALMPMDMGTLYYRIPAICCSADGQRLVVLTDDRKNHGADLPSHCYVVAQYSEDGGRTWSEPVNVAGTAKTGGDYGHGDASLITNRITGEITGIMTTSANGNGYFASTPSKPQTWKTITSKDGGRTWSIPADHTKELYAQGSPNPNWLGGFSGSGAGLQKRDGTLVSPFVNRESPDGSTSGGNITQNYYSFMSKDGGKTWYVSGKSGTTGADEPKIIERNNGDLAISVRHGGYNFYNYTTDDGETWKKAAQTAFTSGINGNACDGEYMYWCSTLDGNPWNIVLQTGPNNGSRQNVSIALSTNEGQSFLSPRTICPRGSAYSAATVLPDGTLGVYYEENGLFGGYTMRFVRFSLDWASGGKYKFTDAQPFRPIQSYVEITTPATGVNTIVLPFPAAVPEGMTVYECTDELVSFTEGGVEMTGTVLQPLNGAMEGFHPYVFYAEPDSKFVFERPVSEWQPQSLPKNCEAKAGPLVGWFVNESFKGDGATLFTAPKAEGEGVSFNLMSKSTNRVNAYTASYAHTFEGEAPAAIRIFDKTPSDEDAIHAVSLGTDAAAPVIYDLQGRKVMAVPAKGSITVQNGRKIMK